MKVSAHQLGRAGHADAHFAIVRQLDALIQSCLKDCIALFYSNCLEAARCLNVYLVCLLTEALPSESWTITSSHCYSESCSGIESCACRWSCSPWQHCLAHAHASLGKPLRVCVDGKWLRDGFSALNTFLRPYSITVCIAIGLSG